MSTCEAKTAIELAEEEVKMKEAELKESTAKLEELKRDFKIPAFFRNMTGIRLKPRGGYAGQIMGVEKPYQKWMMNELKDYNALPQISGEIIFSANCVERIYNVAVDKVKDMAGHPKFPEKFIPRRM